MDTIRLENFRCFRKKQTARLAPLTLLVGDNSTGKTSFMAIIRALWQLAYGDRGLDFNEEPYDLGSFDQIAHNRGDKGSRTHSFRAGFDVTEGNKVKNKNLEPSTSFDYIFERNGILPIIAKRTIRRGKICLEETFQASEHHTFRVYTNNGSWDVQYPDGFSISPETKDYFMPIGLLLMWLDSVKSIPLKNSPSITAKDIAQIRKLSPWPFSNSNRPFASAPVRSKPKRYYEAHRNTWNPEGDYIPKLLSDMSYYDTENWEILKNKLEIFGKASGLFDEISIKRVGRKASNPFQVQVTNYSGGLKGPKFSLVDVGYGVSQVLPVITELLHETDRPLYLLQQPEIHLHPSAQAALGSLFCQEAGPNRQLVVETHSDHLLNRVRIDVRDGDTLLNPEDVSILFFEGDGLDVNIHSIGIDSEGNIVGAPKSYGQFFMEELKRTLWKRQSSERT